MRGRGGCVGVARWGSYLVLELADAELLHLLHALPLLLLDTRGLGRRGRGERRMAKPKCSCSLLDSLSGRGRWASMGCNVPSGAPPWRPPFQHTFTVKHAPEVYSHAALSHVRAASLLVAGSFQRTAGKISKSVDSSSSSLFSPPPPHSAARVPHPGSAATKWAASSGSSTRGSRPPTANPNRHPARASGRSRRPRGITRPRAPSRRPSR